MVSDRPHRRKRDDPDGYDVQPKKQFAYSEAHHKDAAALKKLYRGKIKSVYTAYVLLSKDSTGSAEAARAFQTLVAACQGGLQSWTCRLTTGALPDQCA